jgi:N-acyl-D-aspartate/D-glutamate deacylase
MLDVKVINGKIVDGTGRPWFYGTVGILGDEITRIESGPIEEDARKVIDANGKVVSPGFCDPHTHAEFRLAFKDLEKDWAFSNHLVQGVTTVIGSVCGISAIPSKGIKNVAVKCGFPRESLTEHEWDTIKGYKQMADEVGLGPNYAFFTGNWTLRETVLPPYPENKITTSGQLQEMKDLLEEQLKAGALGLSIGLNYDRCPDVRKSELLELAKVAAKYDRLFNVTARGYYSTEAYQYGVEEAIDIARQTGVKLHIAHFGYFVPLDELEEGRTPQILKLVEEARKEGIDVTFDMIPYASHQYPMEMVGNLLVGPPPRIAESPDDLAASWKDPEFREIAYQELMNQGDKSPYDYSYAWLLHPDSILTRTGNADIDGLTMSQVAKVEGISSKVTADRRDILALIAKFVIEGRVQGMLTFPLGLDFRQAELSRQRLFDSPYSMPMSDGFSDERSAYGSFAKYFQDRTERGIALEEIVRHMTSLPLHEYFFDRGLLAVGQKADIVVFDAENFKDQTTHEETTSQPTGIEFVLVNGTVVVENGRLTDARPGKMLLKPPIGGAGRDSRADKGATIESVSSAA